MTTTLDEAQVHVIPMNWINDKSKLIARLEQLKHVFSQMIVLRPTGWAFNQISKQNESKPKSAPGKSVNSFNNHSTHLSFCDILSPSLGVFSHPVYLTPNILVIQVSYSEHSSYQELKWFVNSMNPRFVEPTVNRASEASFQKMMDLIDNLRC